MLLFPLLLAVSQRRPNLVELGLSLLWFHFALSGFRYVPLWVVVAVPLLARSSVRIPWLQQLANHLSPAGEGHQLFASRPGRVPWLWSVVAAVFLFGRLAVARVALLAINRTSFRPRALDRFLQLHREWRQGHGHRPVVFHSYDWGGYLTWHGGPGFRNWIDDRNEVQGKEHIQEYFSILETDPGWREKLDRAQVELICVHPRMLP